VPGDRYGTRNVVRPFGAPLPSFVGGSKKKCLAWFLRRTSYRLNKNSDADASREHFNSSLPGLTRQSMLPVGMRSFWICILASRPRGALYVGVASDLIRRVQQHREGLVGGFSKQHSVKMLVYYEEYATAREAIQREKNIKHWPRK